MKRWAGHAAIIAVALGVAGCDRGAKTGEAAGDGTVARGRYLVAIMDCAGCHNTGSFSPKPEAGYLEGGTVGFEVPGMGVFYPPNLTPDPDAGLGKWSEADIVRAIRTGVRPDGRQLSPAMPWPGYAKLTDEDARAIAAYLKSLPPSPHRAAPPATVETASAPYLTVKAPGASAPRPSEPRPVATGR